MSNETTKSDPQASRETQENVEQGRAVPEGSASTAGEASSGGAAPGPACYQPPDEATYRQLLDKAQKADLLLAELLRAKADLDNFQKRVRRERQGWEAGAVRDFIRELLPVLDNFERALGSASGDGTDPTGLLQGVRIIYQMLQKTLSDHGVVEIEALDKPFDPDFHHAVAEIEVSDRETGEIVAVEQKGYVHGDVVVRPSLVRVAKKVVKDLTKPADDSAGGRKEASE
jgi:molecular chaperone GrpE